MYGPPEEEEKPEEVKEPPPAELDHITTNVKNYIEGYFDFECYDGVTRRVHLKYRRPPSARVDQIYNEVLIETAKNQVIFKRTLQKRLLDEMIVSILDRPWKDYAVDLDGAFGEALRMFIFKSSGVDQLPPEIMGELLGELKKYMKEEIGTKRDSLKRKML